MQNFKDKLQDQREHFQKEIRRQHKMQFLQKKRQLMLSQQNQFDHQLSILRQSITHISQAIQNNDQQTVLSILEEVCQMLASQQSARIRAFDKSNMMFYIVEAGKRQWHHKATTIRQIIVECFNRLSKFEIPDENSILDSKIMNLMLNWLPLMSRGQLVMCIEAFTYSLDKEKLFKCLWNNQILSLLMQISRKIPQDQILLSNMVDFLGQFLHFQSQLFELKTDLKKNQIMWIMEISNTLLAVFLYTDSHLSRDNAFSAVNAIKMVVNCGVDYVGNPKLIVDLFSRHQHKDELTKLTATIGQIVYQSDQMAIEMVKNTMLLSYLLKILTVLCYSDEKRRVARILSNLATIVELQYEIGSIVGHLITYLFQEQEFNLRKQVFRTIVNWSQVKNYNFSKQQATILNNLGQSRQRLSDESVQTIFWLKIVQKKQHRMVAPTYIMQQDLIT